MWKINHIQAIKWKVFQYGEHVGPIWHLMPTYDHGSHSFTMLAPYCVWAGISLRLATINSKSLNSLGLRLNTTKTKARNSNIYPPYNFNSKKGKMSTKSQLHVGVGSTLGQCRNSTVGWYMLEQRRANAFLPTVGQLTLAQCWPSYHQPTATIANGRQPYANVGPT